MLYWFLRTVIRFILLFWRRWRVIGLENLPAQGGVVVVANHVSNLDPVVVGCALNRQVHFMAKIELFRNALLGMLIRQLGAFPVNREKSDRQAIRTALELLHAGRVVGIFPEGTRSKTGEIQKPHLGAALLAFKADAPLLPVAVKGTRGFFSRVTVVVGKPIYIPDLWHSKPGKGELEQISDQVMGTIAALAK